MTKHIFTVFAILAFTIAFSAFPSGAHASGGDMMTQDDQQQTAAVFAGGCFWCMEAELNDVPGVIDVVSGYTGGHVENPTYEQVSSGGTGHVEAVRVTYDPAKISYEKLLTYFWGNIDPFDSEGQFCDKGEQYRAVIFYGNEQEKAQAEWSKQAFEQRLGQDIATLIRPAETFYPAEDYHQNYYKKNPTRYKFYKWRCGRDSRLDQVWGDEKETAPKGFGE